MSDKPFATGRCQCGAVSYAIAAPPAGMGQCHCKDCQRASGTGHMSLARFKRDDVIVTGKTKTFAVKADSGNVNTRHFCPNCGSRLFGENSAYPGMLNVTAGTVDDNSWFSPQRVLYTKERPAWDVTTADVPTYAGMPPPA